MEENLSLFLARRQKRLKYWQERFDAESLDPSEQQRFSQIFGEYNALIAKAARATDPQERDEACRELETIDREMTSLFEARRLLTDDLGVGAVTDESTRGSGGSLSKNR